MKMNLFLFFVLVQKSAKTLIALIVTKRYDCNILKGR